MTHAELVARAAAWLRTRCCVVVTELSTGIVEQPDALGWEHNGLSHLVECKASRTDFRKDAKKWFRRAPETGVGRLRWYMTPPGLLKAEELPPSWGLLEAYAKSVRQTVLPEKQTYDHYRETSILLSAMRRIGHNAPPGVNVKCYTFDSYEKKSRATLGIALTTPPTEGEQDA